MNTIKDNRPVIIAIVGESGAGKTTLALHLHDSKVVPTICSYTTRPMREEEADGVEHFFVNEGAMPDKSEMLAYTKFGEHHYWTNLNQIKSDFQTYVIDEDGLINLRENWWRQFRIVAVCIKRPNNPTNGARKDRDKARTILPPSTYDLTIINRSLTAGEFVKWATIHIEALINRIKKEDNGSSN